MSDNSYDSETTANGEATASGDPNDWEVVEESTSSNEEDYSTDSARTPKAGTPVTTHRSVGSDDSVSDLLSSSSIFSN
jgi:hypothetical protein